MTGILMCGNKQCSKREKCFRYRAKPSSWQSYAIFEGGENCHWFIPLIEATTRILSMEETAEVKKAGMNERRRAALLSTTILNRGGLNIESKQ